MLLTFFEFALSVLSVLSFCLGCVLESCICVFFTWYSPDLLNLDLCALQLWKLHSNNLTIISAPEFHSQSSRILMTLILFLFNSPQSSLVCYSFILRLFSILCCCLDVLCNSSQSSDFGQIILSSSTVTLPLRPSCEFFYFTYQTIQFCHFYLQFTHFCSCILVFHWLFITFFL